MNIMAIYHVTRMPDGLSAEGLTTVRKGRHLLASTSFATDGELMSTSAGFLRNRQQLSRELGIPQNAASNDVVIAAYRRWGEDYPAHLEGSIMTVLIDRSKDRLVASRDRIGDTRLFYCRRGRTVAVSDHPDALALSPYASTDVDISGLNSLFFLGPARIPGQTPYKDVMALEPGCMICAERTGVTVKRYYTMQAYRHCDDIDTTVRTVREMLETSVSDIMPYVRASMLSGGLDSTALTAIMHENGASPMTFSVDYIGDEADFTGNEFQPERDRDYADMAASLFSSGHENIALGPKELCGALGKALNARGLPGMADIDSSLLLFCERISGSTGAVVSGECGDEVFCGYPWFKRETLNLAGGFPWSGSIALRDLILKREVSEELKGERYVAEAFETAAQSVPSAEGESEADRELRIMQSICFKFFMSNLQERALCMAQAASIKIYTPFSDERLVEYLWNVPGDIKFLNGEVKGLLREAVKDLLPEKLLRRRKSPYPKVYSPEYTTLVKMLARDILSDRNSPILEVVDHAALRKLACSDLPAEGLPWFGQLMSGPQMLAYIWQINEWMRSRHVTIKL